MPIDNILSLATKAKTPVCTENLIRVDDVLELPKLADDRAARSRSGRHDLAIQVEVKCRRNFRQFGPKFDLETFAASSCG